MHRGAGTNAGADQRLRAFLTFDQHHRVGLGYVRLVVERAWIGRCEFAALGIPGPELLLAARRVVAVDHGDEFAGGVEVVPLGGGFTQLIDWRFLLCLA